MSDLTHDAVAKLADVVLEMTGDGVFTSWSCGEIEILAEVLSLEGFNDAADAAIDDHSIDDDEGDEHYGRCAT